MTDNIKQLLDIMVKLRDPENGCPWDLKQNFDTIAPYTIEEAYEVADAVEQKDMDGLKDELGDLLFQVAFFAQMADEKGLFNFTDVVDSISKKMIHRHPHIFSDAEKLDTAEDVIQAWEKIKDEERKDKGSVEKVPGALDGVTKGLPSLLRAYKLQKRASRVGFEWDDISGVTDKIAEELEELRVEIKKNDNGENRQKVMEEFGDLMFVMADLARWQKFNPEDSLRAACTKFERRFKGVEAKLSNIGKTPLQSNLKEMDNLWNQVKEDEKKAS